MLAQPIGGKADGVDVRVPAKVALNAYQLIATDADGDAIYATSANPAHINRVLGVSTRAGLDIKVRSEGVVENPGWNWSPEALLWVGLDGVITEDPGTGAFTQAVGFAKTPTSIYVRLAKGVLRY